LIRNNLKSCTKHRQSLFKSNPAGTELDDIVVLEINKR